jgi:hypothetical protein
VNIGENTENLEMGPQGSLEKKTMKSRTTDAFSCVNNSEYRSKFAKNVLSSKTAREVATYCNMNFRLPSSLALEIRMKFSEDLSGEFDEKHDFCIF